MARYTLERINKKIENWEAADDAVALNQSYGIGGKQLTRADAAFIEQRLDRLYAEKRQIELGASGPIAVAQGRVKR